MGRPGSLKMSGCYWSGDFARLLRTLNPRLICKRGDTGARAAFASVYLWTSEFDSEDAPEVGRPMAHLKQVCGVPVGWLPERTIFYRDGHIWKRGWREVLNICHQRGLIRLPRELARDGGILTHGHATRLTETGSLVPA